MNSFQWNVLWSHDCITCFLFDKMFYDHMILVGWNVVSHDFLNGMFMITWFLLNGMFNDHICIIWFLLDGMFFFKSQVCNKLFVINENVMITKSLTNEVLSSQMIITDGMNKWISYFYYGRMIFGLNKFIQYIYTCMVNCTWMINPLDL